MDTNKMRASPKTIPMVATVAVVAVAVAVVAVAVAVVIVVENLARATEERKL